MKSLPLIVKTFVGFLWLVAMATPASAAPDLVPILTAPQNGAFGVRNAGTTAAAPTLLLVGCNTSGSGPICPIVPPDLRATYSHPAFPYHALVIRVPALQPGERFDHQVLFWNQRCWPAGTYRIPVQADGANSESENDEANNHDQSTFVSQRNCPPPPANQGTNKPDLRPILPTPPYGIVVVLNIGRVLTGPTRMMVSCRKEGGGNCPTAFGNPNYGVVVMVPGLRPDERFTYQLPFWNKLCWKAGSYQISVKVDSGGVELESNEANNEAVSTLVVTVNTVGVTTPFGNKICVSVPQLPQPNKPGGATPVPGKPATSVVPAVPQPVKGK